MTPIRKHLETLLSYPRLSAFIRGQRFGSFRDRSFLAGGGAFPARLVLSGWRAGGGLLGAVGIRQQGETLRRDQLVAAYHQFGHLVPVQPADIQAERHPTARSDVG